MLLVDMRRTTLSEKSNPHTQYNKNIKYQFITS